LARLFIMFTSSQYVVLLSVIEEQIQQHINAWRRGDLT